MRRVRSTWMIGYRMKMLYFLYFHLVQCSLLWTSLECKALKEYPSQILHWIWSSNQDHTRLKTDYDIITRIYYKSSFSVYIRCSEAYMIEKNKLCYFKFCVIDSGIEEEVFYLQISILFNYFSLKRSIEFQQLSLPISETSLSFNYTPIKYPQCKYNTSVCFPLNLV